MRRSCAGTFPPSSRLSTRKSSGTSRAGVRSPATTGATREVLGFFQRFMQMSGGTFRVQIEDLLANERRVLALVTESAEREGRNWSSPQVHAWTIEHGKATVFWQFQGDQQTEDEFWS